MSASASLHQINDAIKHLKTAMAPEPDNILLEFFRDWWTKA